MIHVPLYHFFALVAAIACLVTIAGVLMMATHEPGDRMYVAWERLAGRASSWALSAAFACLLARFIALFLP